MNIVLFEGETKFLKNDARYQHIKKILKLGENGTFIAGIVNGAKGEAKITSITDLRLQFLFTPFSFETNETQTDKPSLFSKLPSEENIPLPSTFDCNFGYYYPIIAVIGSPRPIQVQRILRDLASLGVYKIWLCGTELGEKSYLKSNLVSRGAVRKNLLAGAMQSGETFVPEFLQFNTIKEAINKINNDYPEAKKIVLDISNEAKTLSNSINKLTLEKNLPIFLFIGSERGWSKNERSLFKENKFNTCTLGKRILRTETASTLAVGITIEMLEKIHKENL